MLVVYHYFHLPTHYWIERSLFWPYCAWLAIPSPIFLRSPLSQLYLTHIFQPNISTDVDSMVVYLCMPVFLLKHELIIIFEFYWPFYIALLTNTAPRGAFSEKTSGQIADECTKTNFWLGRPSHQRGYYQFKLSITVQENRNHLDKRNSCVKKVFVDYSSEFNTIVPSRLESKLRGRGGLTYFINTVTTHLSRG